MREEKKEKVYGQPDWLSYMGGESAFRCPEEEKTECVSHNDQANPDAHEKPATPETDECGSGSANCSFSGGERGYLFLVEADNDGNDLAVLSSGDYDIKYATESRWDVISRIITAMLAAVDLQQFSVVKLYRRPLGDTLAKLHMLPKNYTEVLQHQTCQGV